MTGRSFISIGNNDIVTIKYNSAGIQQWVKTYNGILNGNDEPVDMTFDNLGNIILTGRSTGQGSGYDCITIKYDYNGNLKWVKRYNGTGNGNDKGKSITTDTQGGVVITGESQGFFSGTNTSDDIITIKYDCFGNQEWLQRYNGPDNSFDGGLSVTTDENNDVYITGYSFSTESSYDLITIKYTLQGNIKWIHKIITQGIGVGVKVLNSRNRSEIYSIGGNGTSNTILCYDYSGNLKWQVRDIFGTHGIVSAVLDDNLGMLYVAAKNLNGNFRYMVLAYNTSINGGLSWYDIYNGTGSGNDYPSDITIDDFSNIYLTGYSASSVAGLEYLTLKYSSSGVREWEKRYNNSFFGEHHAYSITTDNEGSVYVTGHSQNASGSFNHDFATVKYAQSIVFGKNGNNIPAEFKLYQNYPNPFNPSTNIKFDIPNDAEVKIAVYDMLGREVKVLVNEYKHAGSYEVNFDASEIPSGTYFYKLSAGIFIEVKKMVLIK
ncbi:MAG: SBBP repeat-containing protein [Ignavibacteria bacterium]|nr:SBBP repeat-containing protein [Ignavibacteria bacterium]